MGSWLFGCDICQTVCPWNLRVHGGSFDAQYSSSEESLVEDLRYILTTSNRELERTFEATPLARVGGMGLKRNALIVAGNRRLRALENEICLHVLAPRIGDLAKWAYLETQKG
jgi:epoxyqueuosine reductase